MSAPSKGYDNDADAHRVTVERTAEASKADTDAAIAAFVAQHYDRLLGLARLICRDASDAADAVQLGLEQAWRKRAALRDETPCGHGWIGSSAVRPCASASTARVECGAG